MILMPDICISLTTLRRAKILNKLAEAHRAGLRHMDFAERNVLTKNGEYRLTDLLHAKPHDPPCKWKYDFLEHLDDDAIDIKDVCLVKCKRIKREADEMRFWDYGAPSACLDRV